MSDDWLPPGDALSRYRDAVAGLEIARLEWQSWDTITSAESAVLACAPGAPAPWWPGGWVLSAPALLANHKHEASRLMWQTEVAAAADRPLGVSPDVWTVRWIPIDTDFRVLHIDRSSDHLPLDEAFWQNRGPRLELKVYLVQDSDSSGFMHAAEWISTAIAGGILGNAAWDGIKATARRLSTARRAKDLDSKPVSTGQDEHHRAYQRALDIEIPSAAPPVINGDTIDPSS